jgi:cold shock CspA family protein
MESQQRFGTLRSWHEPRGFGIIEGQTRYQRYFLHITRIVDGPVSPKPGDKVYFDVTPARKPDGLPQAIRATIVEVSASEGAL